LQISNYFRQIGPKAREEGEFGWMVPGAAGGAEGAGFDSDLRLRLGSMDSR
jgi:hypothetical protein